MDDDLSSPAKKNVVLQFFVRLGQVCNLFLIVFQ